MLSKKTPNPWKSRDLRDGSTAAVEAHASLGYVYPAKADMPTGSAYFGSGPKAAAGAQSGRGLANKIPEHSARLAAVLAIVSDPQGDAIVSEQMEGGINLAQHYLSEALRLFEASQISGDLRLAQRLQTWLLLVWDEPLISLPDIYQYGPNAVRDKQTATKLVRILEDHGWLIREKSGGVVRALRRRDVWRTIRP